MCNKYNTGSEFEYTIAMCNLNNAGTLEESIKSIVKQIDSRFEILVTDDGSTDGSLEILERLEHEITNLRFVIGDNNNLGEARNHSFQEANGRHILESLDLDDKYQNCIPDFIKIYETLYKRLNNDFFLKGRSINAASRSLLLEYPYRSMGYGEDVDLWRRLFADNKLIWLEHAPFYETLREERHLTKKIKNTFYKTVVDFRSGVTFSSFFRHCTINMSENIKKNAFLLFTSIPAYIIANKRGRFDPPAPRFQAKGAVQNEINTKSMSLQEMVDRYDLEFSEELLSDKGYEKFINISKGQYRTA